ncbi:MAG: sugar ABC transporter permease [Anaerolineae bacterium]|nr:sugar ABC transporter permease [Anaerolineae bacterium]
METQARLDNLQWSLATVVFIIVSSIALGFLVQFLARLRGLSKAEQRKLFWGVTFAGPWIVGFFIFVLGPALASLYYSFTDYQIGDSINWIGVENYRNLLSGEGRVGRNFNKAMLNSFYYAVIGVPLQITAALIMAMLLNNEIKGIRIFRMIFYMPVILAGGPAILLAWRYMLGSNGGFVNESMRKMAGFFFVFDYIYRGFIFVVEALNGFYTGIVHEDPVGPLKYTIPAAIAALLFLSLVRGEWGEGKRLLAWRGAQILGIIVFYSLLAQGLIAEPVDPSWIYVVGIVALGMIVLLARQGKREVRYVQWGALVGLVVIALAALNHVEFEFTSVAFTRYLIPLALVATAVGGSLIATWDRHLIQIITATIVILSVILFVRLIPGQLDDGRLNVFTEYLTFGSTLDTTTDQDYLEKVYPVASMSPFWIYGLVIAVLIGVALLDETYARARRYLATGALIFFALFAIGSFLDARTYFKAFEEIATAAGKPVYHFALFRQAIAAFPGSDRVPLWMNSELWSKPSAILITMWSSGAGMLIFLAALKGVPQSMYEAAEVDGATASQRFFKITLPMISPAMFYNIVIGVIAALQTFEIVYILQTPLTRDSLQSAAFLLYTRTFSELHIGEGAAMSWILVVIILTLTVLQFRFSRSWVHYEA